MRALTIQNKVSGYTRFKSTFFNKTVVNMTKKSKVLLCFLFNLYDATTVLYQLFSLRFESDFILGKPCVVWVIKQF